MSEANQQHIKHKKLAEWMDSRFTIPGTGIRFGLDPLLGLVTGVGDFAGASVSLYFIFVAAKQGGRPSVLIRMFLNIAADLVIGMIPLLGDLFDFGWKANLRNARLLHELEQNPAKVSDESRWLVWIVFGGIVCLLAGLIAVIYWAMASVWSLLYG